MRNLTINTTGKNQAAEREGDHTQRGPAMFAPILDCQILISGGMGQPAYDHALAQGLEVILPMQKNIADALDAYRAVRWSQTCGAYINISLC